MSQNFQLTIYLDSREHKLINLFDQKKLKKFSIEIETLDVGDILLSEECIIERKEGFDFMSSLIENRLFEQAKRLVATYNRPILLLEGLNQFVFQNINLHLASIYGALTKLWNWGISIVPTLNLKHTAIFIERMVTRLYFKEKRPQNVEPLPRSAPKKLSYDERKPYILEGLIDCGPNKAEQLINYFDSPYNVFQALKNTNILYTRSGNPKGIGPIDPHKHSLAEVKGFGPSFVEKNQQILFNSSLQKSINLDPNSKQTQQKLEI